MTRSTTAGAPRNARATMPKNDRRVRRAALTGLAVACLAIGVAGCSGSGSDDRTGDQANGPVQSVISVEAPLNAVPTSGQDPAEAGETGPADPPVTGIPTPPAPADPAGAPATPVPVSTAGPIEPAGNIDQIVPEAPVTTAPAVALTDTADFGGRVTARISQVSAIQANATLPGEVAGPAVAVTVEVANGSAAAIGLDTVTVTAQDAAGNPATSISADPAAALTGSLDPGATASGTYVFTVPTDQRNPITVTVNYSTGAPTLVFSGAVAGG